MKKSLGIALIIGLVLVLAVIGLGVYMDSSAPTADRSRVGYYDNFGIAFQYPPEWGIPKESFYGNGLGAIDFDNGPSGTQPLMVLIQQDMSPTGSGAMNESFGQMIARFKANDKYIYDTKEISADGIQGKELLYNNAVNGQSYHAEAFFPLQNGSYLSIGADYAAVPEGTFDSVISSLKWDSATAFQTDPATGMAIYSNNGFKFEYPIKFKTNYASLTVGTSIKSADSAKLDSNGCSPVMNDSGKPSPSSTLAVNGTKFCTTSGGGVGAGQLYTDYAYTTIRNGNAYTIDYGVHTSNGCGVYENSPDLNSTANQKYNECLAFGKDYENIVTKPIQESIATFRFAN